jgi:hypothetical protein
MQQETSQNLPQFLSALKRLSFLVAGDCEIYKNLFFKLKPFTPSSHQMIFIAISSVVDVEFINLKKTGI